MNRKAGYLGLGVVLGAAATVAAPEALSYVSPAAYAAADTYRQLNLFGDVFDKIRNDYVEKPDEAKLIEAAINGMLASLDPHSSYMDARAFKDMQVQTKGEFGGLGIEVTQEDGLIKVVTPIDDTPAAKAGIRSGDVITAIDDTPTQGLTLDQAVDKMRGAINSPVKLKVVRGPKKEVKDFTIVRDLIRVQSVRSHVEDGDVGYIRVTQFTEQTADGLKAAMEKLKPRFPPTSSRATFSICATIRADCSTSRSTSSIRLSTGARLSRLAAARRTKLSGSTLGRAATCRVASRSSSSSTAVRHRRPRSSPERCKITSARRSSAHARSAKARCRPSCRSGRRARSG